MDALIKSILQIESDAQRLVADVKARQEHFDEECVKKKAEMEQDIMGRCEKRMQAMQEAEEQYRADELAKIRADADARRKRLNRQFEENKDKWEQQLLRNILGGE